MTQPSNHAYIGAIDHVEDTKTVVTHTGIPLHVHCNISYTLLVLKWFITELNSGPGKNVAVASVKYHDVPGLSILAYSWLICLLSYVVPFHHTNLVSLWNIFVQVMTDVVTKLSLAYIVLNWYKLANIDCMFVTFDVSQFAKFNQVNTTSA